jgi:hypothetical protein
MGRRIRCSVLLGQTSFHRRRPILQAIPFFTDSGSWRCSSWTRTSAFWVQTLSKTHPHLRQAHTNCNPTALNGGVSCCSASR